MDLGIKGKSAVVTASSSGLGRAIAFKLADEGANVALFARTEAVDIAAEEIRRKYGTRVIAIRGDMRMVADVKGFHGGGTQRVWCA